MFNNILSVFLRQVLTAFIQIIIIAIIAQKYGAAINGNVVIILMIPAISGVILNFGLSSSIIYYYTSKKININILISDCLLLFYFFSFISVFAVYMLIPYVLNWGYSDLTRVLISLSVFCSLFSNVFNGVLIAKESFAKLNMLTLLQPVIMLSGILITFCFGELKNIYENIVVCLFVSYVSSFIYLYFSMLLIKVEGNEEGETFEINRIERIKLIFFYGFKSHVSNVVAILNYKSDIFIINYMLNPVFVGIYAIFSQVSEKLWMLSTAVCSVALPRMTSMLSSDKKSATKFIMLISRIVLYATTILCLLLLALSDKVIYLFFGEEYIGYTDILYFLLPGIIVSSHSKVLASYFSGIGKPELNLYSSILSLLINLLLNFLLIPVYGIYGAAAATLISYTLNFLIKFILFYCFTKESNLIFSFNDFKIMKSKIDRLRNV